jgi:hypothetical protein
MFHFFDAITNTKGDALVGYFGKVIDPSTGNVVPIYSDDAGTAIVTVSGVADTAKVDTDGNLSLYVTPGTYHLDIYGTDGDTFQRRIQNLPMGLNTITTAAGSSVSARTLLAAIANPIANQSAILTEPSREGTFVFDTSDLSAEVTADTAQGVYVAPSSDTTGASGAWVRHPGIDTWFNVRHFGAVGDDVTDDYAAIQCALNVAKLTGGTVWFPAGLYHIDTGLVLSLAVDGSLNIRIQGTPGSWLRTSSAIDLLTISNTNAGAANTRRVLIDGLAFLVNNASARGLVLTKASYNQFSNIEFLGIGTGIVVGTTNDTNTIHNQFTNIRPQQIGNGIYIGGQYNVFTNVIIGEGITGQYAIKFDGFGNVVSSFAARGAGGSGGTATVEFTGNATGSSLANGLVFDSYAVGVHVASARYIKVTGVSIWSSQTHGLQLSGALQGRFDVALQHSGLATSETYHHINCLNTPTDNTITAQFVGSAASKDINEASGTNNVWICGTLPNGNTISGNGSYVIANGSQQPNVQAVASAATVTPTFANDEVVIAAQAVGLTLANPTGTTIQGKRLLIRIKDNGTSRSISYGTVYRAVGVSLPSATTISNTVYLTAIYNNNDAKWDVINVAQEA